MMADDGDLVPVRDTGHGRNDKDSFAQRAAQQRSTISKWNRDDLEDKYLRIYEENLVLKKHARKQEDKIKRMATKLLRLVNDKKKADPRQGAKKIGGRDIEAEEMMEELHSKVRDLEKQNTQLRERLMVTKQQLATTTKRNTAYGHVQSRINTGIAKPPPTDPRIARNVRVTGPPPTNRSLAQSPQPPAQRYGHSLLEEARAENRHLEDVIDQLQEQTNIYEQDIELLKEQMRVREAEFEEDILRIKQQMSQGQSARTQIQENIDLIRLQREVKEKSTKLTALNGQYANLEDKLRSVKGSHDQVLIEMERINSQLKDEQNRVLTLQNELKTGSANQRRILELQEQVKDMERECEILREANEKLVNSAFDMEREREWRQRENALKVQIAQLEATLKSDVGEKGSILDRLSSERDAHEKLEEDHKELRIAHFQLKQESDELREKMKFFTKESAVDFSEIEEALMIVKQRKEKDDQDLDFLHKVDDENVRDYQKLVRELQAEHADTINELEKTRNMLIVQHKINKDYQMEVEAVTRKMDENQSEYEVKMDEQAHLLDMRAARIRKLESQLHDVAYGTRQYRVQPEDDMDSDVESLDETLQLERGQNVFEIHIKRLSVSQEGLTQLGDAEPSLFCTYEFYEHEIQSTPIVRGATPEFKFTSQYLIKVDEFFLHYMQKDSCTLEVHHSMGTDYMTVAACQLRMRDLLDKSTGRYHGSVKMIGTAEGGIGVNYGTVEYWVRLRVPMAQALRLYKERSKALGYLDTNQKVAEQALEAMDEAAAQRPSDNINELTIKVIKCQGIKARRQGVQPSPFVVYKFFDFDDHDTTIIQGSNNPQFNDHKTFPVPMTADLDKYLKSAKLDMYIFDDTDPDVNYYLGRAKLPLIQLAHDKPLKGIFEIKTKEGEVNGSIEVTMKWKFTYLPPKSGTRTKAQQELLDSVAAQMIPAEPQVALMPGEQEQLQQSKVVAGAPGHMRKTPAKTRPPRGPAASSTPMVQNRRQRPERDVLHESELQPVQYSQDSVVASSIEDASASLQPQDPDHTDLENSMISEGSHVSGESEPVSVSETSTPRQLPEGPPVISVTAPPQRALEATAGSTMASTVASSLGDASDMDTGTTTSDADNTLPTETLESDLSKSDKKKSKKEREKEKKEKKEREKKEKKEKERQEKERKEKEKKDKEKDKKDKDKKDKDKKDKDKDDKKDKEVKKDKDDKKDKEVKKDKDDKKDKESKKDRESKKEKEDKDKNKKSKKMSKEEAQDSGEEDEEEEEESGELSRTKNRFSFKGFFARERKKKDEKKGKKDEKEETVDDMIASELGEKPKSGTEGEVSEDTMFGDDPSGEPSAGQEEEEEEDDLEEVTDDDEEEVSEDSEGVVMPESPQGRPASRTGALENSLRNSLRSSLRRSLRDSLDMSRDIMPPLRRSHDSLGETGHRTNPDIVVVTISRLSFEEDSHVMKNSNIKMLFVEYRFLGIPLEETETPFSLPKPKPGGQITFNFRKVFHVDFDNNYERRQYLASMLLDDDPDQGRVRFTVVSEPPEGNEDGDCEDVGVAFVSIRDILDKGKDVVDQDVPIYDIEDESTEVGQMNLTVECLAALTTVQMEMAESMDAS